MKNHYFKIEIAICIAVLSFLIYQPAAQNAVVNLNSEKQAIKGFGGINCPAWISDLTADQTTTAFGNGTGQIGMTILRIMVNDNSSNWSKEVATAKRAAELGAIVFASPWNPPGSMCETVNGKKRLKYDSYNKYADHLNSFVTYMKDNGVNLYAISIQNEPDYADDWTWWTPQEILNFMKINASTILTKVIAPESFQYIKTMSDPILNDPAALANMDILGAHLYGTQVKDFPYTLFKQKGNEKELWMTEHYTESKNDADNWPLALDVATEIHNAMVEAEFNAYVWWYIRRSYGMIKENSQVSKRGYCMAQFSKFIRPGYKRVDATKNPTSGVYVSAYKNSDDVVIVAVNTNASSKTINFSIDGTKVTSFTKYTTSSSKNVANLGNVNVTSGAFSAALDAQSVSTWVGKGNTTGLIKSYSENRANSSWNKYSCKATFINARGAVTIKGKGVIDCSVFDLKGNLAETISGINEVVAGKNLHPGTYIVKTTILNQNQEFKFAK